LSEPAIRIIQKYTSKVQPFQGFNSQIQKLRYIINEVCNGPDKSALVDRDGKASLHTTRHTFATLAIKNGASLFDVSTVLGHTSQTMTTKYAHLESYAVSAAVSGRLSRSEHTIFHSEQIH
jgi:integrase